MSTIFYFGKKSKKKAQPNVEFLKFMSTLLPNEGYGLIVNTIILDQATCVTIVLNVEALLRYQDVMSITLENNS